MFVQNHGPNTPLGSIFVSDGSGRYYSLSLENVLKGLSLVDFEKINSLEGVFIANRYDIQHTHDQAFNEKFTGKKNNKDLSDAEVSELRLDKMSRRKEQNQDQSMNKK